MESQELSREFMKIGELSQRTGVAVKTIRFYSDQGLLPPNHVTSSRYRLYDTESEVRLELIRTLRRLDFDLETIGTLLEGRDSAPDLLRLQLDALDADLRRLRRSRAVVAHAVETSGGTLEALQRLQAVAVLDRCEREAFLSQSLDGHLADVGINSEWRAWLYRGAFADLPEELDRDQWQALLELTDLVSDEDFGRSLAESSRPFWKAVGDGWDQTTWQQTMNQLKDDALAAMAAHQPLDGEVAQALVDRWVITFAQVQGREPDEEFQRGMLRGVGEQDPRTARFWQLVSILRGGDGTSPMSRAFGWLHQALALRHTAA